MAEAAGETQFRMDGGMDIKMASLFKPDIPMCDRKQRGPDENAKLPPTLYGDDVVAAAQSGVNHAFGIPMKATQ